MARVGAVLLAAGESRRMGACKQRLLFGRRTLLRRALDCLLATALDEVVLVLGCDAVAVRASLGVLPKGRVRVVICRRYRLGMSASLRCGVRHSRAGLDGILVALGDQPCIRPATVRRLLRAFRPLAWGIVAPCFQGRRGHPVIFHRRYRGALLRLRADQGARALLRRHRDDLCELEVRSAAVLLDVDRPADLRRLRSPRRVRVEQRPASGQPLARCCRPMARGR